MLLRRLKRTSLAISILVWASSLNAQQVIFSAAEECSLKNGSWYFSCPNQIEKKVAMNPVSSGETDFIRSMPFYNQFSFQYRCETEGQLNAFLSTSTISTSINTGIFGEVHKMTVTTSYKGISPNALSEDVSNINFRFVIPSPFTRLHENCKVVLESNFSYPDINLLNWHVDDLQEDAGYLLSQLAEISNAQELPTQWSIVSSLPDYFSSQRQEKILTKTGLEAEVQFLSNLTQRNSEEELRLEVIKSEMAVIDAELVQIEQIQSNVSEAIANISVDCQSADPLAPAQCLAGVSEVKVHIQSKIDATKNNLETIKIFLESEATRLSGIRDDLVIRINQLLQTLN